MINTRKFATICLTAITVFFCSCDNKSGSAKENAEDTEKINQASKADLEQAVADRDELLSLVNEISTGLDDIKNLESIVSADGSETPSQKARIRQDITAIQDALAQRRKKLEELEKKLSSSNVYTTQLAQTIESLKAQIETQSAEIASLNAQLAQAKGEIASLNTQVDSLNTTVSEVTDQRNIAQATVTDRDNELNTVYIAVGNKKQLKEARILEKKFLSKTKILANDFDHKFFTQADKRTYTGQTLTGVKKAEIKTNMPAGSYTLSRQGNNMVLTVTNPAAFWSNTSYLVIQTN